MAALSNYLEAQIMNHLFRNTAMFTTPTNVYVALFTSDPTDAGSGTEVSGGSYARQAVACPAGWNAPVDGVVSNVSNVVFPQATANWGTVTHVGIFSAVSGGNLLFHGPATASKVVNTGERIEIAAGALQPSVA